MPGRSSEVMREAAFALLITAIVGALGTGFAVAAMSITEWLVYPAILLYSFVAVVAFVVWSER